MKKRIVSLLLVACTALSVCPFTAYAADNGEYNEDIGWAFDSATGTLTVSGFGDMPGSEPGYRPWEEHNEDITAIVVGEGITSVGDYAFMDCCSAESVLLSDSITHIGNSAFYRCESLLEIELPEGLESVSVGAFAFCESLTEIELPEGVTVISDDLFECCTSLTSVGFSDDVTYIGSSAFYGCSSLVSFELPAGVTELYPLTLGCCRSLSELTVDPDNEAFYSESNCIIERDSGTVVQGCTLSVIPDDGSVTVIGECAFTGMDRMTSISIPNGITEIHNSAFSGCSSVADVYIPESVTYVGPSVFSGCDMLASIFCGGSAAGWDSGWRRHCDASLMTNCINSETDYESTGECGESVYWKLDTDTFTLVIYGEGAMTDYTYFDAEYANLPWRTNSDHLRVVVEEGVTHIGAYAFYKSARLTSISLPKSLVSIGDYAFYSGAVNTAVSVPEFVTDIGDYAFYSCPASSVAIGVSVKNIGNQAFRGGHASTLKLFSAEEIGPYAFAFCSNLTSVELPDNLKTIENNAFYGCGITSAVIPESVEYINTQAFGSCDSLESLTVEDGNGHYYSEGNCIIRRSDSYLVQGCNNSEIPMDGSIKGIENGAFYGLDSISSVIVPEGVSFIEAYAFAHCSSLESIAIPESTINIGRGVFEGCTSLTKVYIPAGIRQVHAIDPNGNSALADIYCGDASQSSTWSTDWNRNCDATVHWGHVHTYENGCDTDCPECGYIRQILPHEFESDCDSVCDRCGDEREAPHSFDNSCDPDCSECGHTRDAGHTYDGDCDTVCNACGSWRTAPHVCVSDCDVTCDECGAFVAPKASHSYDNSCDKECNLCGYVKPVGGHSYDNECDRDCNNCGEERDAGHSYGYVCSESCSVCGEARTDGAEHTWEVLEETDKYILSRCILCGAEKQIEKGDPEPDPDPDPGNPDPDPGDPDDPGFVTVLGDLNGDGNVNATDYLMLKRAVLGTFALSDEKKAAADINGDGNVNGTDYLMLKRVVLGTYTIG